MGKIQKLVIALVVGLLAVTVSVSTNASDAEATHQSTCETVYQYNTINRWAWSPLHGWYSYPSTELAQEYRCTAISHPSRSASLFWGTAGLVSGIGGTFGCATGNPLGCYGAGVGFSSWAYNTNNYFNSNDSYGSNVYGSNTTPQVSYTSQYKPGCTALYGYVEGCLFQDTSW